MLSIVRNRRQVSVQEVAAFYIAGDEQRQFLEIVLGISQKVISNYVNHLPETPIGSVFEKFAWTK